MYSRSVHNIKRHIAKLHKTEYSMIMKYAPEADSCRFKNTEETFREGNLFLILKPIIV